MSHVEINAVFRVGIFNSTTECFGFICYTDESSLYFVQSYAPVKVLLPRENGTQASFLEKYPLLSRNRSG